MVLVAQPQGAKVHRIGFLGVAFASGYVRELDWIRAGLRDLGYVEGRNLVIEYRWAEGNPERLREMAAEFAALKVDAILTHALPGAIAAARVTSSIPIVMADGGDPVIAGLAKSLAGPGGNVTGSTSFVLEEIGKRLQLLREVLPRFKQVAFLSSLADAVINLMKKKGGAARRGRIAEPGGAGVCDSRRSRPARNFRCDGQSAQRRDPDQQRAAAELPRRHNCRPCGREAAAFRRLCELC
ncbi:MAG: ABC transporter substrate-binding protein [Betaproteobacteria bacterium]|nr:ABC transporter substrate-binding protein [Betaproteobacteria bacterium]